MDKFASRALPVVFLGYSLLQKGYKLFSLHTKEFLVNRDVTFKEHVFPFQHLTNSLFLFSTIYFTEHSNESAAPLVIPFASDGSSSSHISLPVDTNDSMSLESLFLAPPIIDRRISTRQSRPLVWLRDYHIGNTKSNFVCLYPLSKHLSYANLSHVHSMDLAAYSSISEPSSFEETSHNPKWIEDMKSDVAALEENNTWSIIDLPLVNILLVVNRCSRSNI